MAQNASSNRAAAEFGFTAANVRSILTRLGLGEEEDGLEEAFFLKVTSDQWASIGAIRDAVAYLGFDPRKIITEFLAKARAKPPGPTETPAMYTSPGKLKYEVYEKNHAATDLLFFITLFLERGNNIAKMLLKCDKEVGNLIRRKCSAYGVITEKKQSSTILGTSALTLSRLSQAFPVATASIIISGKIPGKLKTKALVGVTSLPLLMQHTIFPILIPEGKESLLDMLKNIAVVLNIETSILLALPKEKRKLEEKDVDDLTAQAEQYVNAAITSGSPV